MSKHEMMDKISSAIKVCKRCRLHEEALNAVPGEGNIDSDIVFIGEAPGRNEDETGMPFVGRAGKLLEEALKDIGYSRKDVWIGNIIKHRPPDNRDPLPDEIAMCEKFLEYQLKLISPILIVTLGRFALNYFHPDGRISSDRGNILRTKNFNVYPVYHPAAALRNPEMMRGFKQDFKRIPQVLDLIKERKKDIPDQTAPEIEDGQLGLGL